MGSFQYITSCDGFAFPAYVAQPTDAPKGAIVVLQEIFGVNSHIQTVTDGYAAQGYLAVAPSTFHRIKADVNLGYSADDVNTGKDLKAAAEAIQPQVMQDVQAAVDFALKKLPAGKRVGVVGYCWGGLLTWRAASLIRGISAAVPYYGAGMTVGAELTRQPQCPVMVHFGDQDASIPIETVHAFIHEQPKVEVQTYAANHGFNCDQRGAFNAPAAELALKRTLDFFTINLVAS
ncbi:MAG: dienelactone hydrolase family protein [Burkholderiaceae bacterium]